MKTRYKRRYSGNDRHFWPFTLSEHNDGKYQPLGITLDSGGENDDGNKGCNIKFQGLGYTLIVELPQIIQDFRIKHIARSWDAATVERLGRNYYYEVFPKEYGFAFSDRALFLRFGPQTHDSLTAKSKCYFLPWLNWRHVRNSMYDLDGGLFFSESGNRDFRPWYEAKDKVPKATFRVKDDDGQEVEAKTHIEEREWRLGEGWFKWLSLFCRPKIIRSLEINFNAEVGPEKGSWKGGLTGTSINMLPGESPESAFLRFCEEEHRSKYRRFKLSCVGKVS